MVSSALKRVPKSAGRGRQKGSRVFAATHWESLEHKGNCCWMLQHGAELKGAIDESLVSRRPSDPPDAFSLDRNRRGRRCGRYSIHKRRRSTPIGWLNDCRRLLWNQ